MCISHPNNVTAQSSIFADIIIIVVNASEHADVTGMS